MKKLFLITGLTAAGLWALWHYSSSETKNNFLKSIGLKSYLEQWIGERVEERRAALIFELQKNLAALKEKAAVLEKNPTAKTAASARQGISELISSSEGIATELGAKSQDSSGLSARVLDAVMPSDTIQCRPSAP